MAAPWIDEAELSEKRKESEERRDWMHQNKSESAPRCLGSSTREGGRGPWARADGEGRRTLDGATRKRTTAHTSIRPRRGGW